MAREFLMGNEAMALGALASGLDLAAGYPGTPSTEVLETIAKRRSDKTYVEWSVNEKAALEAAAGAAYSGARVLVTMKQVGLNVASDPLMSLAYIGVRGAMVVLVADDPGPISSQTEQDTRTFAKYSKLPVFDPSSVKEAYEMIQEAFQFSHKYGTPVLFRPTTRIDHSYASLNVKEEAEYEQHFPLNFEKDPLRWVIFPKLSLKNHALIEKRNKELSKTFSGYARNFIVKEEKESKKGIVASGISYAYARDILKGKASPRILKVSTPFPFPEELAGDFLSDLDEVLVLEELDPVLERELFTVCGKHGIEIKIKGKLDGTVKPAGENTPQEIKALLADFLHWEAEEQNKKEDAPPLPVRPPVLCAGCPHRASFYAVKQAMKGEKAVFCGDIGCYTLGNAKPLDMCDTCLCMGAGITIAQGIGRVDKGTKCFAFIGDSTFFASGLTGVVNAIYNQADLTVVILDNSTTAMTGHQPHPGTGQTLMGEITAAIDPKVVLQGLGVKTIAEVDPLDLELAVATVKKVSAEKGVKAIIFRYPCIVKFKPQGAKAKVDEQKCVGCQKCIRELGCPGLILKDKKAFIDDRQCTGCSLCQSVCAFGAIVCPPHPTREELVAQNPPKAQKPQAPKTTPSQIKEAPSIEKNIILCGVGGQGTVLASRLLAATAMRLGLEIKTAETIGMAQRGGSVVSHIKIGKNVHSPIIGEKEADLILGFEIAETLRNLSYLKDGGKIITSSCQVIPVNAMLGGPPYLLDEITAYLKNAVPDITLIDTISAAKALGSEKIVNVLMLGQAAKAGLLGFGTEDIMETIKELLPPKLQEINLKALLY
ncbi:indolepyruvate ferredoxin oxidoreductase subunit alpha [bacterium]|nr:indolepyruvate ferredoxin oxidoreductase subunit alpha [bacterium]